MITKSLPSGLIAGSFITVLIAAVGPPNGQAAQSTRPSVEPVPATLQLTEAQEERVNRHLNASRRVTLKEMADTLRRTPQPERVFAQWDSLVAGFTTRPPRPDLELLIHWTLRAAFLESEREIEAYRENAEQFETAQHAHVRELDRAYAWIDAHRATGDEPVEPPFLPDRTLPRPQPIMGLKPPAITAPMATRRAVGDYALALNRRRARLQQDAQLVSLALRRAQARQRELLDNAPVIRRQLLDRPPR